MDINSAVGRNQNVSAEETIAVRDFASSPLFNLREKIALEYAEEMCRTPVRVSDELFARLRQHFTEDQIVELTAAIAFENYRARFNHALDIESDHLYDAAR
jgi:alkylhydroperoxidase family enzyme